MRVLANLCSMVPGKVGGSETYATRLLEALAVAAPADESGVQVEIAAMAGLRKAHPELESSVWHEQRLRGDSRALRMTVESTWLARRSAGFDLVHHFGGRLPARHRRPAVLTIHDLQPLDMPDNFSRAKRLYLAQALPRSARSADLVTVPSAWVAERVIARLGVPAERVVVVPSTYRFGAGGLATLTGLAAHESDGSANSGTGRLASSTGQGEDATNHGVEEPAPNDPLRQRPFVLYPAATFPHKNHDSLIWAHAATWPRHRHRLLVLTGGTGRAHAEVATMVAETDGVIHLGRVSRSRLAWLMANAAALAFPSRYEGFGLPVLEAMAVGTPVMASSAAAVPEVLGAAGTLVDPDDIDGWAVALLEAGEGSQRIRAGVQRGLQRAAEFSPERSARRLLGAWRQALT